MLPRTTGNCNGGICFIFIFCNTVLRPTAKQSSRGSQRFKNTSKLTERHFTRRNCRTKSVGISKQGQGSPHAGEGEAHVQWHVHHSHSFLHRKQDRQHSGYCSSDSPKFHLLHKSHQTQENKPNLTSNRVLSINDYRNTLQHCKESGRGAGYKPQQNKACPKMLRRWSPDILKAESQTARVWQAGAPQLALSCQRPPGQSSDSRPQT